MIRGTTPTHTFKLPFDVSQVKEVMVIYAQNDVEILRKNTVDCEMSNNEVCVTLSQEDTLRFSHYENLQVQLRVLTVGGVALTSGVHVVGVQKCLNNEVII